MTVVAFFLLQIDTYYMGLLHIINCKSILYNNVVSVVSIYIYITSTVNTI